MSQPSDAIAVIGYSGCFPGAPTIAEFWQNLRSGAESVRPVRAEDAAAELIDAGITEDPRYVPAAAPLDGPDQFDADLFGYNAREATLLDPQQRVFLEQAWAALEDAGYPAGDLPDPVGVYASANLSTYLTSNLLGGRVLTGGGDALELLLANDKDYLASRVGYKLGCTGPAVTVQSACSSSLVAVHSASQALLNFECDMALAGGVALRFPQRVGYLHQEGLIFAADGHCRPFDAGATGTVAGNGAGVVVLKRLADAVADHDHIEAVLLGSAVNNDGFDKVGFTAPSVCGQTQVISTALGVAEVDPATITAVEAHGTGTPLGDPIEVAALTRAYRAHTGDAGYCALSSVKGNVGHLDSAAGITGLIKALLQLRHGELVPNINYERPNPRIDFDASPFYVNGSLQSWKSNGTPRRIGVSSFGMGGTNAHVIVQEPPESRATTAPQRPQILVLSARTPAALDEAAERLADHLRAGDQAGGALADAAFTLQVGRRPMRHRRVVVAGDVADAVAALAPDSGRALGFAATDEPRLVWMFPGQGSQYPGMGAQLYRDEPVFRAAVDECLAEFAPLLPFELRERLFPQDRDDDAAGLLRRTEAAQPAIFTAEYAMARLLDGWGLRPDAMIGHSIGEVSAACWSGVLDLPAACRLVAARATLMQDCPEGAMLSVAMAEERLAPLLPATLALAAVNAPELCVVSGPHGDVARFEKRLTGDGVACRRLHTSHAFHSAMMEPMLAEFGRRIGDLDAGQPAIPYVSNRTGRWVSEQDVRDPDYWVRHVREPVRFADSVTLATDGGPAVLLEVGPGRTLGTLARQSSRAATVLQTMPGADDAQPESGLLAHTVGRLWLAGRPADWAALHAGERDRTRLPGYPFQRRRYFATPRAPVGTAAPLDLPAPEETATDEPDSGTAHHPRPMVDTEYVAPRDELERRIAQVWEDLLGVAPVGAFDHFFELGGHSLLATRLVARIQERLGAEVPLPRLLAAPTVAALGDLLREEGYREADGDGAGPGREPDAATPTQPDELPAALPSARPDPDALYEPFPLSEIQQAQWVGRMSGFAGGDVAAHVYWEIDLSDVDLERLERAWNRLMDRHQMLRAIITADGTQRILRDAGPYRIEVLDLSAMTDDAERDRRLSDLRDELSHLATPTDRWPLFDIRATRLPAGALRLHLGFELLLADIGSIRILLRDWHLIYTGRDGELPPLELSYRDYIRTALRIRDTALHERSLTYWRQRVAELPPAPDLPVARSPETLGRPEFVAHRAVIPQERWDRFVAAAARNGVTPSAAILAAYATVVGAWARSPEFTLNVTVTNRFEVHEHVGDLVGEFASFDLLPARAAAAGGIAALARDLQERSWADLEYRYLNGVDVLRELARHRGGTRGSVMPVVFTSTLTQRTEPAGESMFGWLGEMTYEVAQTPQVWMDAGVLPAPGGMQLSWHGVRDLFPAGLLDAMFTAFHHVVGALSDDEEAWRTERWDLLPDAHRRLVDDANDTAGPVPDALLTSGIAHWAAREPGRTAVIDPRRSMTFGDLYGQACRLAGTLRGLGVGPNQLVGVAVAKSCEQVVAAVAVLLAGGAYLPIDPDLPQERQDFLIGHGQARVVLTGAGQPDRSWPAGVRTVPVDLTTGAGDPAPPEPVHTPDDLAYVVYTSGSTGTPKGVMLTHRAALNTLVDINDRFAVGADDRVLGLSSLSFDLSVWDLFGVLGAGGAVVLPETGARRDPQRWLELVREHRITVWNSVPALMQMFVDHLAGLPEPAAVPLRLALLSGDWIPLDLPDRLRRAAPDLRVISLGGATEAAVWSIAYPIGRVPDGWDSVPYGRPLRNQTFHVFNDRLQECPLWVTGELYIGGVGVAAGYWREPERTAASFITHPRTGERLYRTGDLGRWRPEGLIEFLGREDFQVKIGGFRIELGEVEAAMLSHAGVDAAVAAAVGPDRHHRRLVGYLVPTRDAGDDIADRVREALAASLPAYLVPSALVVLDKLPLTANGKVDRGRLPDPARTDAAGVSAPRDARAARLCAIVAEVTGLPEVHPERSFLQLGGDSITGVQVVSRAAAENLTIRLQDLFQTTTLAELAATLPEDAGGDGTGPAIDVPLTALQQDLLAAPGVEHVRLAVDACVGSEVATAALRALLERHPALRTRCRPAGEGRWTGHVAPLDDDAAYVPLIDLSALPGPQRPAAVDQMVGELAEELDVDAGPVIQLALLDLGDDGRLLVWLMPQALADAASWALLLREFFQAAAQINGDRPVQLPPPTEPFGRWSATAPTGPAGEPGGCGAGTARCTVRLDAERTATLLHTITTGYRMSADQAAAAVLAAALGRVGAAPAFDIEYDGRAAVADVDASRTCGQFAIRRALDLPAPQDPHQLLVEVKRRTRDGLGTADARGGDSPLLRSLGGFGDRAGAAHERAIASPVPYPTRLRPERPLTVTAVLFAGEWVFDAVFAGPGQPEADRFAGALRDVLEALCGLTGGPGAGHLTTEDFPLADLDAAQLAAVLDTLQEER